ncbi:polycomb group RING finger protein 1-like [Babylonia areolata]|uniref:polycomb group RING finger protein 1-like n=1 Tax=Babylonia areolata TaxID=304850 RepID=UPI003FD258A1
MAECKPKRNSSCSSGSDSMSDVATAVDISCETPTVSVTCKNRIDENDKMWVPIRNLNEYIVCGICHGYLFEATTITECMHSFCKSCIVRHLERSLQCPTCRVLIHPTDPFVNMRLDRLLQDIVYGLLPAVAEEELAKEKKFYSEYDAKLSSLQKVGQMQGSFQPYHRAGMHQAVKSETLMPQVNLLLNCKCSSPLQKRLDRRFVRVTGEATVHHVALLIRRKLLLPEEHAIELYGSCQDGCVSLESTNTLSAVKAQHFEQEDCINLEYEIRPWECLE